MNQPPLFGAQVPTFARNVDEPAQFFFRVRRRMFGRAFNADEFNCAKTRPIKRTDRQTENFVEQVKRERDPQRHSLRHRQSH